MSHYTRSFRLFELTHQTNSLSNLIALEIYDIDQSVLETLTNGNQRLWPR